VTAIKLVNDRISKPCVTQQDGDAIFATLMILTNQTAFMQDAMLEFVTMLRGCDLVAYSVMPNFEESAFSIFTPERHVKKMQSLINAHGEHRREDKLIDGFINSVILMTPLCKSIFELKYCAAMQRVIKIVKSSARDGEFSYHSSIHHGPSPLIIDLAQLGQNSRSCI
jgi:hypothetical protein